MRRKSLCPRAYRFSRDPLMRSLPITQLGLSAGTAPAWRANIAPSRLSDTFWLPKRDFATLGQHRLDSTARLWDKSSSSMRHGASRTRWPDGERHWPRLAILRSAPTTREETRAARVAKSSISELPPQGERRSIVDSFDSPCVLLRRARPT